MDHFDLPSDHSARPRVLAPDLEPDVDCAAAVAVPVLISAGADLSEWLARLIHDRSARRHEPFVVFRPGGGDELRLLTGVLNGAGPDRGTLFVAEVGRAGLEVQRLLRQTIATAEPARARFRLIAATSAWLFERVERGEFDDRLFYGLNKIHIAIGAREKADATDAARERRPSVSPEISPMDVAAFRRHRQRLRAGYALQRQPRTAVTHHG